MKVKLDDYRCKLINRVLFASSQDEVKACIESAMRSLAANEVHSHAISLFVEQTIKNLEEFSPMDYGAQQWANIHIARIKFHRISSSYR